MTGQIPRNSLQPSGSCHFVNADLNSLLQQLWCCEEIDSVPLKLKEKEISETISLNTTYRNDNDRFVVFLPFKQNPPFVQDSPEKAFKRLRSVENQFPKILS